MRFLFRTFFQRIVEALGGLNGKQDHIGVSIVLVIDRVIENIVVRSPMRKSLLYIFFSFRYPNFCLKLLLIQYFLEKLCRRRQLSQEVQKLFVKNQYLDFLVDQKQDPKHFQGFTVTFKIRTTKYWKFQ